MPPDTAKPEKPRAHSCDVPFSHGQYRQGCVHHIRVRYLILRSQKGGDDSWIHYCIDKAKLENVPNLKNFAYHPSWDYALLERLLEQVVIIKHPMCSTLEARFGLEQDILQDVNWLVGAVNSVGYERAPDPYVVMKWIRGFSVKHYLWGARCQETVVSPAMTWHILFCLLEAMNNLRNGYPKPRIGRTPIMHGDMHEANMIFDPYRPTAGPFPAVVLIDFGRASRGPSKQEVPETGWGQEAKYDWYQIGELFHSLAHQGYLTGCAHQTWKFAPDLVDGTCKCVKPAEAGEFGTTDIDFTSLMAMLTGPNAASLTQAQLRWMIERAWARRKKAVEDDPSIPVFDLSKWDYAVHTIPIDIIVQTLREAFDRGELKG